MDRSRIATIARRVAGAGPTLAAVGDGKEAMTEAIHEFMKSRKMFGGKPEISEDEGSLVRVAVSLKHDDRSYVADLRVDQWKKGSPLKATFWFTPDRGRTLTKAYTYKEPDKTTVGSVAIDFRHFVDEKQKNLRTAATQWKVIEEDGYVKVYRGKTLIAAGIVQQGKRLRDLEFMEDSYRKSNPTRLKVVKLLQAKGYS